MGAAGVEFRDNRAVLIVIFEYGDLVFDQFLNRTQKCQFIITTKRQGLSALARAGGASNPVDVGFRLHWKVEVNHQGDIFDVDAAGGDIGGDEHWQVAIAEAIEGFLPGCLGFVAMNGVGFDTGLVELLGEFAGAVFGAAEDQAQLALVFGGVVADQIDEQLGLVAFINEEHVLIDFLGRSALRCDADIHRFIEQAVGELGHLRCHGGGEK